MGKSHSPRSGSMQFWPRKRAKSEVARVRFWKDIKEAKPCGFSGYKVGMVHVMLEDTRNNSMTKGQTISWPATIVECPPLTVFSIKLYKNNNSASQIFSDKLDKELQRSINIPTNKKTINDLKDDEFDDLKLLIHTNPSKTTVGKKKPEIFEIALGGKKEDKIAKAKEILGKEISINDVFTNGQIVDIHAITKGKGFQGPVKRFGIALRNHRSEKTKRGPGSLGGWKGHAHNMYRIAHAGQMGYHQRTEYNKQIIKIGTKEDKINPKEGFKHYGIIKNDYILLKGSIAGPNKRLIRFNHAIRPRRVVKEIEFNIKIIQ
jgi:large subunit ribosomal protein L3